MPYFSSLTRMQFRWLPVLLGASWLAGAIQSWFALRYAGFAVPIGVGVTALAVLFGIQEVGKGDLIAYFPWKLPVSLATGFASDTIEPAWLVAGVVGGLLVSILSAIHLSRRDVV